MGTGNRVEANEGAQHGNGDGSGDETRVRDGNGNEHGNGNENRNADGIGGGGEEAKKRKKLHKNCRYHVGNGGDLGGKMIKRRKERIGRVADNPDNLEDNKEEGGGGGHKVLRA